jgi:hypothetical protein
MYSSIVRCTCSNMCQDNSDFKERIIYISTIMKCVTVFFLNSLEGVYWIHLAQDRDHW